MGRQLEAALWTGKIVVVGPPAGTLIGVRDRTGDPLV